MRDGSYRLMVPLLGAVLAGGYAAIAGGPGTQPSPVVPTTIPSTNPSAASISPAIAKLTEQLQSTDWHVRSKAEVQLIAAGEEAVVALEHLAKSATLDEARTAAVRALQQIAENRLIGPSLVTLHMKDASAKDAFEALARQSHVELKPFPDNLWTEQPPAKVSIDVDRQPFWVATRELSKQSGVDVGVVNGEPRLIGNDGQVFGQRYVISGPFLVQANQVNRSQTLDLGQPNAVAEDDFNIQFTVHAEPKLKVLSAPTMAKLEHASDDKGNSLLLAKQPFDEEEFLSPSFGAESAYPLTVWLKYPAKNPGAKIARLKGSAQFTVQVASEKMDLPVKKLRGTTRTFRNILLSFGDLQKAGDNWQLKLTAGINENHPAWDELQNSIMGQLKVVDARGQPLDHHGFGSNGTAGGVEVSISFGASHRPEDGRQSGEPARVVWEIPTKTRVLTVPFEFTDIPMPR